MMSGCKQLSHYVHHYTIIMMTILLLSSVSSTLTSIPLHSNKRGISVVCKCTNVMNATWWYNWDSRVIYSSLNKTLSSTYVPMIWGKNSSTPPVLPQGLLLTYNEPDVKTQSNLTSLQAISLWQTQILSVGAKRIGSPAVSQWNYFSWMNAFLAGNGRTKPSVNFMCVHWYGKNATDFLSFIDSVWKTYKKRIWVTEFSFADWAASVLNPSNATAADVRSFLRIAVLGLENRAYVERYAWYSDTTGDPNYGMGNLLIANKTEPYTHLSDLGQLYSGQLLASSTAPTKVPTRIPTVIPTVIPQQMVATSTGNSSQSQQDILISVLVVGICLIILLAAVLYRRYSTRNDRLAFLATDDQDAPEGEETPNPLWRDEL